jgi:membrane protease YdiL (CAAX protease family)/SAM-dependent methyltransferase
VEAALDLAGLKPGETFVDLGFGDGRMLFAAARRGASAMGVEIRPVLYEGVRKIASDMGLKDRLFLELGDLYESDLIRRADVLYAFLDDEGLRLLKPRLEASLKPGARLVTLSNRIPGWKPLRSLRMKDPESRLVPRRTLYLYVFGKHYPSEAFRTFLTALSTMALFAPLYAFLHEALGYTYGLHVASVIVFAILGIFMSLVPFRDFPSSLLSLSSPIPNPNPTSTSTSTPSPSTSPPSLPPNPSPSKGIRFHGSPRFVRLLFALLTLLFLSEELLLNSPLALYGLSSSIIGFLGLPVLGILMDPENGWLRKAIEASALILATRVVLTPFPMGFLSLPAFLPAIYTLILSGLTIYIAYRRIEAGDVRLSKGKKSLGFQAAVGMASGSLVGIAEFFILKPSPILPGASLAETMAYAAIVLGLMVGFVEELMFRGLLQASLERLLPPWQAIGATSVIFGLMHVGWMNPLEVLLAYGAGIVFGYLAKATGSLVAPMFAHGFGNLVLYLIAL